MPLRDARHEGHEVHEVKSRGMPSLGFLRGFDRNCELAFAANCPAGQDRTRDPVVGSARRRASSARSVWSAPARAGALAGAQDGSPANNAAAARRESGDCASLRRRTPNAGASSRAPWQPETGTVPLLPGGGGVAIRGGAKCEVRRVKHEPTMRGFTCVTGREPRQSRRSCELAFAASLPVNLNGGVSPQRAQRTRSGAGSCGMGPNHPTGAEPLALKSASLRPLRSLRLPDL